jgi:hypothetical protein
LSCTGVQRCSVFLKLKIWLFYIINKNIKLIHNESGDIINGTISTRLWRTSILKVSCK